MLASARGRSSADPFQQMLDPVDRRILLDAVAGVEDMWAIGERLGCDQSRCRGSGHRQSAPADRGCPELGDRGQIGVGPEGIDRLVEADRIDLRFASISSKLAATLEKESITGTFPLNAAAIFALGAITHWSNSPVEAAGPAVEQLDRFDTRVDLSLEVGDRAVGDAIDQRLHQLRIVIGQTARLGLLAASPARRSYRLQRSRGCPQNRAR